MDNNFNEFWETYRPDEIKFPRRRAASFRAWNERTLAARKAMLAKVKAEGAPKWKNPYFFIQDFPEPTPTNLNGTLQGAEMLNANQAKTAFYNGKWGLYSLEDIQLFNLKTYN